LFHDYKAFKEFAKITALIQKYEGKVPLTLKEDYLTIPIGFQFHNRLSPFLHTGNEIIGRLLNAGILQHWKKFDEAEAVQEDPDELKILSMQDLSFGFVLWLGACGTSSIAFSFEILWMFIRRVFQKTNLFLSVFFALWLRLRNVVL
jgi:hypothetical protein